MWEVTRSELSYAVEEKIKLAIFEMLPNRSRADCMEVFGDWMEEEDGQLAIERLVTQIIVTRRQ